MNDTLIFIRKICDFEEVWVLNKNGWAMTATDDGCRTIAFWPEKILARICAKDEWNGYIPTAINLNEFTQKWLPGMTQDTLNLSIFITNQDRGIAFYTFRGLSHTAFAGFKSNLS